MIMISTQKKSVRLKRIIEFLKTQLEDYDTVDMTELVDFSEIESRFIFDRFFKKVIEEVILFHKNEESLYEWAREVKDDNYEILDRTPLLCKWLRIEKRKLRKTIKYLSFMKLNKTAISQVRVEQNSK